MRGDTDVPVPSLSTTERRAHRVVLRRRIVIAGATVLAVALALSTASWLRPHPAEVIAPPPGSVLSHLYHYSAIPPPGWTVTFGVKPWSTGSRDADGVADVYRSSTSPARITVVSQPLAAGQTAATWIQAHLRTARAGQSPACFSGLDRDPYPVDGVDARRIGGSQWCGFTDTMVVANGRGYVIAAEPDPSDALQDPFDYTVLDAFLDSIRWRQ